MNGLSLADFSSHEEALKVADQLIQQSMHEYNHDMAVISYGNQLTDRYFYIKGQGRVKSWGKSEEKTIGKSLGNVSGKQLQALGNSGACLELLAGSSSNGDAGADKSLQKLKALFDVGKSAGPLVQAS